MSKNYSDPDVWMVGNSITTERDLEVIPLVELDNIELETALREERLGRIKLYLPIALSAAPADLTSTITGYQTDCSSLYSQLALFCNSFDKTKMNLGSKALVASSTVSAHIKLLTSARKYKYAGSIRTGMYVDTGHGDLYRDDWKFEYPLSGNESQEVGDRVTMHILASTLVHEADQFLGAVSTLTGMSEHASIIRAKSDKIPGAWTLEN